MQAISTLKTLKFEATECVACPLHLYNGEPNKLVWSSGPTDADLMFVGEAPGENEVLKGVPFVGIAGKKLNVMLAEAGISRGDVYVTNILKHRPLKNRRPEPVEIQACMPYLRKQIELVAPKVLVLLGASAIQAILGRTLGDSIGTVFKWNDVNAVLGTYHPSYVCRQPRVQIQVVEQFKLAKQLAEAQ